MKKIIAFAAGTAVVVGIAIGVQAFATTSNEEGKQPAVTQTTAPDGSTTTAPKEDDGTRTGFTEDHTDKPGETK
jgi:hypothetical protein